MMKFGSKEEWLRYSGLNHSAQDRWLRDNVATLFDIEEPTAAQKRLQGMASIHLTLMDLPDGAGFNHKAEFLKLAQDEFGMPPS